MLNSNGFPCLVRAINSNTENIVASVPTNGSGAWSLSLPNGTFRIKVAPGSLPPGVLPPASVTVTTSGGIIVESAGTPNDGVIPLTLSSTQATLTGSVEDPSNNDLFAFVLAIDTADGEVVGGSPTGPNQPFSLPLFDGTFDIVVDPPSLPLDAVPPVPTRVSVSGGTVSITSAGSGSMVGNDLVIGVTLQSSAVSVPITIVDGDSNPIAGVVRVRDGNNNLLFFLDIPASMSGAPVLLGDGAYSLSVLATSLPPGFDAPAAQTVTVTSPTASPSSVAFTAARPTLTGTISGAASSSTPLLAMDLLNAQGVVLSSGVTLNGSGSDATYSVDLGEGSFTLRFRRATGVLPEEVLLPENVTVNVADGVIQNPDDDSGTAGVQVDIDVPEKEGTVRGTVTLDASPVEGLRIVVRDPVDQSVVNEMETDSNGDFSLAVPAGFFKLRVDPGSLAVVAPAALPATPYEIQITSGGDISVVGNGGLCSGSGPGEICTSLDFALTSFDVSTNAQVTGTVTARQTTSSTATAVAGATVLLIDSTGVPVASAVTNNGGAYSLIVTEGIYEVIVDPSSVQASFPTVPEPSVTVTVSGTNVTESDTTGTSNVADDGIVNFIFEGASALVQGRVQTQGGTGVGSLLAVTAANQTEVVFETALITPTDPAGNYFLPMGAGNFKLWVLPSSLPPGFLPPQPTTFSVSGSTVTESNTAGSSNVANDGIINPVLSSGGGTILGQVEDSGSNPVPAFVALLQPASNPSDPPLFVTGAPTNPSDGTFEITAPDGSYLLEIDPFSLPPGLQAPQRITLSVSGGTVSYGPLATTTTVGPDTVVVFTVSSASDEIRGTVKDSSDNPFPVTVFVRDVTNDAIVNTVFLNPSSGSYSVLKGNGTYDVLIDPGSVPPGFVAPAPVRVTISGGTVTESNVVGVDPNGGAANSTDDGVVNFVLQTSGANLTGYVRDSNGDGVFAGVGLFQANSSGNYNVFVTGATSDFETGFFSIPVVTGTYQVKLDPGSLPPGVLPPAPVTFSVSSSTITFPSTATTEEENSTTRLILTLQGATGGVSGAVTNSSGNGVPVFVLAEDATTNEFVAGAPTNTDGSYELSLPAGLFRILVEPDSVPQGSVVSSPQEVSVTTSVVEDIDFSVQTAANTFTGFVLIPGNTVDLSNPAIDCSDLGNEDVTPVSCTVALVIPSQDPNSPPTFLGETQTSPSTGSFSFPLGDGNYQLVVDAGSLPTGVVPPSPVSLVVTGSTVSVVGDTDACSNNSDQLLIFAEQGAGSLTGTVVDGSSNGVGCFVELINATNGSFVSGTPTDPASGDFAMSVGSLSYELRVAPDSVPPGLAPPAPVSVTVSGGTVTIGTGPGITVSGSDVTIQLSSASATVSGSVTDSSGNGLVAFVQVFDSNDNFVGGAGTTGATGTYSIPLAPGIYEVKVDPFSLPPGFSAPAPQTVNLVQSNSATADFTATSTAASITGKVFFIDNSSNEVGVPAFVEVVDAVSGAFIAGVNANADSNGDFVYSIGVGSGSFRVRVAPDSLPPGVVAPGPVGFTVSVSSVNSSVSIQEDSHGSDSNLTNGVIDFQLQTAGATLNGRLITDDGMGGSTGVVGFVYAELADGSGTRVSETPTNGQGNFSMSFADGNYRLIVDPQSLPPGLVAPPPRNMTVVSTSITIAGTSVSGAYEIDLATAGATLTGNVAETDSTPVVGTFVVALDPTTDSFITGSSTDTNGDYSLSLGDGSYLIVLDPTTLPAGAIAPAPQQVSVSGSTISQNSSPISNLDFVVGAAVGSVAVEVSIRLAHRSSVKWKSSTHKACSQWRVPRTKDRPQNIGLGQGSYFVTIPGFSLPPGIVSPEPVSLTVNGDGTTVDGAGASGDSFIRFTLNVAAATLTGNVTFSGSGVAGATVAAVNPENDLEVATALTAGDGSYSLELPSGEFLIEVVDGVPTTAVQPAPFLVFVDSSGTISPAATLDFALQAVDGVVSGTLSLNGAGHSGYIVAFVSNMSGGFDQVSEADADSSGAYTLNLPLGDFVLVVGVEDEDLPSPSDLKCGWRYG